jgi:hypothetical protein
MPYIWPGFGQMWEFTDAGAKVPDALANVRFESN